MAITDRDELLSAIADWFARPGDTTITTAAPDWVALAEGMINYGYGREGDQLYMPALRVRQMQERSTASAGSEFLAVPDDFLEVIDFKINTTPETHLSYSTPAQFAEAASSQTTGIPKTYTIIGDEFRFGPVPSDYTAELWYYQSVPALTASATTNWLLTAVPGIYLYGSLFYGAPYVGNDADAAKYFAMCAAQVKALQHQDRRAKYGSAPLIMRNGGVNP
jgi:hypothetical protein